MDASESQRDDPDQIVISRREAADRRARAGADLARLEQEVELLRREIAAIDAVLAWFPTPNPVEAAGTIREMAIAVMSAASEPVGVRSILNGIEERFGVVVPRTSLSPILKKMERRGEAIHVGDRWGVGPVARPSNDPS